MYITASRRATPFALALSFVSVLLLTLLLSFNHASAASLKVAMVRFDRMQISAPSTGVVCATPGTVASVEGKVLVTFPTGYTVSTTVANWAVSTAVTTGWPTVAGLTTVAWPGIGTATAAAAQTVTFPSGDLTSATNLYCFNWTNSAALSITSSASASNSGTVATQTSTAVAIDSSSYATASISSDQIVVSATVQQTFSFALSANTDNLGQLSTASVSASPTPRTATVNTNAKNGWDVWANDTGGLTSASAAYTIAPTVGNTTLSAGTEGYNTGITSAQTSGSGTVTVQPTFVGGSTGKGGGLSAALQTLASSTGTANNAVLTLTNNGSISPTTPAASDYSDTITVVGAGLF